MKLDNKIVLVTGVSSGIGAATASLLRFHGAHVIGIDLKAPNMTLDGFVQGDLSSAESIDRLLPQLPTRIDSLCNIAGVPGTANPLLLAQVNYLGVRHLSRALLPRISAGGSIVNISSSVTSRTPANSTVYTASKGAVDAITRTLANELGPRTIRVNSVNPGLVVTEGVHASGFFEDAFRQKIEAITPLGRIGQPEDIAPAVAFLASSDASWITGETLIIGGGLH